MMVVYDRKCVELLLELSVDAPPSATLEKKPKRPRPKSVDRLAGAKKQKVRAIP